MSTLFTIDGFSVRPAPEPDAAALIAYRRALMAETPYMLYEAGELKTRLGEG